MNVQAQYKLQRQVASQIKTICQPFLQRNKLNYFSYGHCTDDGKVVCLLTNPEWFKYFHEQQFQFALPQFKDTTKKEYYYLWRDGHFNEAVNAATNYFAIHDAITLIVRSDNYLEYFAFAASQSNQHTISFYFNNLDVIKNFAKEFVDVAGDIIVQAKTIPLIIPNIERKILDDISAEHALKRDARGIFNHRELACIEYLRKSFTVKEIARALAISPRTVEDRLVTIREKLGCERKSEIVEFFDDLE